LQELGKFMVRASGLLADLHQLLITVTVSSSHTCRERQREREKQGREQREGVAYESKQR
jgi:hypothetical protein